MSARDDLIKAAKEIIADGCGCDRQCEELSTVDAYCGCEKDASAVVDLVLKATNGETA